MTTRISFENHLQRDGWESFEAKIERTKVLPIVNAVNILNDTLFITTDSIAREVRFIGQNGNNLKHAVPETGGE